MNSSISEVKILLEDLFSLIKNARIRVEKQSNSAISVLFWHIGNRILKHILKQKRGEYGKRIVVTLSRDLVSKFGRSYEEKNLRRMIQFAERYREIEIVVTLSRHLSWSHFLALIPLENSNARKFYEINAYNNLMGVRELRRSIEQKVYERTENANLQLIESNKIEKGIFKDPYFLDFLELKEGYLENDLEKAILKELEQFILELGNGFTFVERQKRMIIDGDDHYLDLLFYHRKLQRLIAIELKIEKFKASHKGQMELYLSWLDKFERQEWEQAPIGLILCAVASKEHIELLNMEKDGIMVAEYWTELPPKAILEAKLHDTLLAAKERLSRKQLDY